MLYWGCLLLVLAPLLLELALLRRGRAAVPLRIHVHGTRGKSGTVRELATALRAQGLRVLAKTTGDRPEYLLPDGRIAPVRRIGPARIQEHVRMVRMAAALGVDALVAEGMALQPETVFQSERILCATHAVVTNSRPDHAETMGPGRAGVLDTLRHMIPASGTLFTAAEAGAERLSGEAVRRGVACVVVDAPAMAQATALARAVADAALGDRENYISPALQPAAALVLPLRLERQGMPVRVYDLLSANDVLSSRLLLADMALPPEHYRVALLATRQDRPLRTSAFMDWLLAEPRFDAVAAMGGHAGYAHLRGLLGGREHAAPRLLRMLPGLAPHRLLDVLCARAQASGRQGVTVVSLGNAHGYGEAWRTAMARASASAPDAGPGPGPGPGPGAGADAERVQGGPHAH